MITFGSAASGDVMMFDENGKQLLRLLGKDPQAGRGIVTVEQLPGAIDCSRRPTESAAMQCAKVRHTHPTFWELLAAPRLHAVGPIGRFL